MLKKAAAFLLFLMSFTVFSQNLTIDNIESKQQSFNAKVTIDSIAFTGFDLKIKVNDSFASIENIKNIQKSFLANGDFKFDIKNSEASISYKGDEVYSTVKPLLLFELSNTPKKGFSDVIYEFTEVNFYNGEQTITILPKKQKIKKTIIHPKPFFSSDKVVFGILMLLLGFVFYTEASKNAGWKKFYKYVPALLICYLLPAILSSFGIISDKYSEAYFIASRFLLPAALVLMTLSIDLKGVFNLGPKALIMFFTGTVGIIIGGPLAILLISIFSPETVGGAGPDAVWRGLSTLAGSWIGGGANQAAMLEIFEYSQDKYGAMVLVDIVVANLWMAILLFGIGKSKKIDKKLNADTSAIERLKERVSAFTDKIKRNPTLTELMIILALAFGGVSLAHFGAGAITDFLGQFAIVKNDDGALSFLGSSFFWMITIATAFGIMLSYTKAKNYEGAGASKIGSIFIYILVASIGMKMDLGKVLENPGLLAVGLVWMAIHAGLLILVAKLIRAPYFFLAVGSQANVGGAASAPIVASAFHPSLTSVGVLLAVFGYVVGTYGAILCTVLMEIASKTVVP
ncbi:putative membrane protein [Kordia periserrulae]|uniref:Putative membrane protein n=1 Tax=Kordia periserrulae TaxID=701523 RepID=A0A2T6BSL6_9FLAO|nr:putative membrane protein [Kordia periserrulae]